MNSDDEEIVLETGDDEEIVLETDDVEDDNKHIDTDVNYENDTYIEDDNNIDFNDCVDIGDTPEINITDVVIEPEKRISKNKMTRYEFVRIIGERIMQLTKGAKPLIKQNKQSTELSYKEIAIEELKANMIPFKIRRFVKDHYEIWKIEELNKKHLETLFY
jgi:DNA-directed RNA polymerase subunit K/omega